MKTITLFFCSLAITAALQAQIPTDGLVGWWPFNGNANDESGTGNSGTVYGATLTTDRFGNENTAYYFDGTNDRIETINSNSLNITGSITISVWVNSNIYSGRMVDKGIIGSPGGYLFDVEKNWFNYRFGFSVNNSSPGSICGTGNLEYNQWANLIATHDSISGLSRLFLNSIQTDTLITQKNASPTNSPLWIGAASTIGPCCFWTGMIDDIRIYNRALTQNEIKAIFHEEGWAVQPSFYNILNDQTVCKNDSIAFGTITIGIPPIHYQWQKDGAEILGANDSILIIPHVQPGDAGEYSCVATNDYGSGSSNTAKLNVEFAIPTTILGFTEVLKYQVATYSVEMQEGHICEFFVIGGNKIAGTTNSITVHWVAAGQGYIKLIETSELGCQADTNILSVSIGSLGIDDQETQSLSVYPNPFSGTTTFFYTLTEPSQVILQIFNAYGKLIDTPVNADQFEGNHQVQWNAERLQEGVFFYVIQSDNLLLKGKIIQLK